jgi:hypothetical protein
LDIRLAINPWIAVQARAQQLSTLHPAAEPSATDFSRQTKASWLTTLLQEAAAVIRAAVRMPAHNQEDHRQQQQQPLFDLDPVLLEGQVHLGSVGGPLTAEERQGCIVTSHSLPGAPLATVLQDIRRFLKENPSEVCQSTAAHFSISLCTVVPVFFPSILAASCTCMQRNSGASAASILPSAASKASQHRDVRRTCTIHRLGLGRLWRC